MVSRIKSLCYQNRTTIAELERTLGFGNGAISKWKKSKPAIEKIKLVADYLGVTVNYLVTGTEETKKDPDDPKIARVNNLMQKIENLSPENREKVEEYIMLLAMKEGEGK